MTESHVKNVIEAALLAAGRPLTVAEISELFDELGRPSTAAIREALATLEQDYEGRGIELKETANGFRIQVRRDLANEISRLWPERPPRYSRALLETLALIAYRQPITRAEIEAVRGVAVNPNIIKTIIERNWVRVVGQRDVPGRPELLGTTKDFLDYFGLRSLEELPPLAELKAMGDVNLQLDLAKDGAGDGSGDSAGDGTVASAAGSVAADGGAETPSGDGAPVSTASEAPTAATASLTASAPTASASANASAPTADSTPTDAPAPTAVDLSGSSDSAVSDSDARAAAQEVSSGPVKAEPSTDADGGNAADARPSGAELGPQAKAAEAFVAEMDDDADSMGADDDGADDDELSAADRDDSGELVAAPPRYDD